MKNYSSVFSFFFFESISMNGEIANRFYDSFSARLKGKKRIKE